MILPLIYCGLCLKQVFENPTAGWNSPYHLVSEQQPLHVAAAADCY
jgi:hypothetical protein